MKRNKILVLSSLSLAAILALASCREGNGNAVKKNASGVFTEETAEYNDNLSNSLLFKKSNQLNSSTSILLSGDVTDETPKTTVDSLLNVGFTPEGLGKISGYKSTYKKVTVGQSVDDISAWGTDNSLVYPGSIVRVQDPTKGNSGITSYGVKSGNIDLSTSMYTSTGKSEGAVKKTIKNATLSNVRDAIGTLVDKNLVDGSVHASQISSSVQEVKNAEELSVVLGSSSSSASNSQISAMVNESFSVLGIEEKGAATGNALTSGNAKIVTNNNSSSGESHYYACIQLTQVYYSMDIDLVYDAKDIITENLTDDRIDYLRGLGGIPGVVSSVKYGRKAVCILDLKCSYSQYIKELNKKATSYDNSEFGAIVDASYKDKVGVEAGASGSGDEQNSSTNDTDENSSSSSLVNDSYCFIYGGDTESSLKAVESTTASEIVKAFTSSVDPKKMVGCPISYTIRSIDGQNSLIKVGSSDTYYERELTPIIPDGEITLSEVDIDKIDNINLGTSIDIVANRQPVDATLFPLEYSLEFDDKSIESEDFKNAETNTTGLIYKKGDVKLATISKKNDRLTIALENSAYLAGQKVTLVAKYEDSNYEEYTYEKKFIIKPYGLTVKNSNGEIVDTVIATSEDGKYTVNLRDLKIKGEKYDRYYDENHNEITNDVIELKGNDTIVLPKNVTVTVSGYGLTTDKTIALHEGDSITYAELMKLISYDSSIYEFSRLELDGKTLDSNSTIKVEDNTNISAILNDIQSYTLTIKDASGNTVETYKTLKQNERCYVKLPTELKFNNTIYNRIFDENHNVVKNDLIELTSDVTYTLPRISVFTLSGEALLKNIIIYIQEGDSNIYNLLMNAIAGQYDTNIYELENFYDADGDLINSKYSFDTTKDLTITVRFKNIDKGSKTFTLSDLGNTNVNYSIPSYYKEYFRELNKNQLVLSDVLNTLSITVDYNTNIVTIDSISGKYYSTWTDKYTEYGLYFLDTVKGDESDLDEAYRDEDYENKTDYGTGWQYILLDSSTLSLSRNGVLKFTDLSNVKLIISVCHHDYYDDSGRDTEWNEYYQTVISLDLSKK